MKCDVMSILESYMVCRLEKKSGRLHFRFQIQALELPFGRYLMVADDQL